MWTIPRDTPRSAEAPGDPVPGSRLLRAAGQRSKAPENPAVYRAAAALPAGDRRSAVHGLRHQLRIMAGTAGATPDWATLAVVGPVAVHGREDRCLFEWTATVLVPEAAAWDDLADLEITACWTTGTDDTSPFAGVGDVRAPARRPDSDRPAA